MTSLIPFQEIRQQAFLLGWEDVGVTEAQIPEEDVQAYRNWIAKGMHADLSWMENEMRCHPQELLPGAKSALIFVSYYKQAPQEFKEGHGLIASYARGRDYHHIHRKRLKKFILWLEERSQQKGIARGFSDSTPILEKALAVRAGLGWFGKNTLLIHRRFGTFILLSGLLTTLEFNYPVSPQRLPRCGSCTRCLDACPSKALVSPYQLDAALCLSYHLIESKKEIPMEIAKHNPGYIFGCDKCQDVCPHNALTLPTQTAEFSPSEGMGIYLNQNTLEDLTDHTESLYGTPLQRRGLQGLKHTMTTLSP